MTLSSSGISPTPFGFAGGVGYQTDAESGLQLLGHRYYDPSLGRFLTRDPIKSGRNWYAYCDNNPLKWVDPEGLQAGPAPPSGPPPFGVPGQPGGKWKAGPGHPEAGRPVRYGPERPLKGQSQPNASWDDKNQYWKRNDGLGHTDRFDRWNNYLTPEEAHDDPKLIARRRERALRDQKLAKLAEAARIARPYVTGGLTFAILALPTNCGVPPCSDMIHRPGAYCPHCKKRTPDPRSNGRGGGSW